MKPAIPPDTIDVDRLRVGMFVQLDGGWMSHPFPLSSFRIGSDEQIATIRALGLRSVRWSPAQSDSRQPVPAVLHESRDERSVDSTATPPAGLHPPEPAWSAAPSPASQAALRREQLAAQRAALAHCERQYDEAAKDFADLSAIALQRPREACEQAEALVLALAGKLLGEHDLCVRLLTDIAGDKVSRHALNVTVISMLMGRRLGLSEPELLDLGAGAMLHDIGKLELPLWARHREAEASSAEGRFYEDHVAKGVALARRMGLSPTASLVIAQHHEHADGSGFPLHLNADRMSFGARIVALVNRYDNLCNPPQPAHALTPHESLSLLFAQGKSKFETAILSAFIRMMGVYPAGSTVQLTDDRHAMVVGVNSSRPLKPRVLVHDERVPAAEALFVDLETVPGLGIRRCIRPQQLPAAALAYLAPRAEVAYFFEPVAEAALAA